jgi:serine/threonine protein kinase
MTHDNLVSVYDASAMDDGRFYTVSQLIDGTTLADKLLSERYSWAESANLIAKIADALHYAHRRGLVHRDVKPANILLDTAGTPYLADFGLALKDDDFGKERPQGGTIAYMSPEQVRGEGHLVDGRSDVFSLGVVFYEMLTGARPFRGSSWQQVLEHIKTVDVRPPRMIDDAIPRELEVICLKALAKRASERHNTALDMAEELHSFLDAGKTGSALAANVHMAARQEAVDPKIVPKGLRSFDENDADFFLKLVPGPTGRSRACISRTESRPSPLGIRLS